MPNPRLTKEQLAIANELLTYIRNRLDGLTGNDREFRFALNRKIAKELIYDERSKPVKRRKLKVEKLREQDGKCAICGSALPVRGPVLDRFSAIDGYTSENTRLICQRCDTAVQTQRKFA
jgi:hypothetical protein